MDIANIDQITTENLFIMLTMNCRSMTLAEKAHDNQVRLVRGAERLYIYNIRSIKQKRADINLVLFERATGPKSNGGQNE
jgi:hypothetical protein